MSESEFSRVVKIRALPAAPVELKASEAERAALAERFALVSIRSLNARVDLEQDNEAILAHGRLAAEIVQQCAVSGEDLPVAIDEKLSFRFVPLRNSEPKEEEIELEEIEIDEIEYAGEGFDLGEAVAQSLGLAIDPYATGPEADRFRREKGLAGDDQPSGPFAALAALKKE